MISFFRFSSCFQHCSNCFVESHAHNLSSNVRICLIRSFEFISILTRCSLSQRQNKIGYNFFSLNFNFLLPCELHKTLYSLCRFLAPALWCYPIFFFFFFFFFFLFSLNFIFFLLFSLPCFMILSNFFFFFFYIFLHVTFGC